MTPSTPPNRDLSVEEVKRREARYRRLGTRDPICSWPDCGETNVYVLTGFYPDISCYEHQLLRAERWPYEAHHVAGRANSDVTADIPGNEHRILSDYQRYWPSDTLRNPEHSPLLVAAAAIRGWLDVLRILIERSIAWIPEFLEWLHCTLVDLYGPGWWLKLGWDRGSGP